MSSKETILTAEGLKKLEDELENLISTMEKIKKNLLNDTDE